MIKKNTFWIVIIILAISQVFCSIMPAERPTGEEPTRAVKAPEDTRPPEPTGTSAPTDTPYPTETPALPTPTPIPSVTCNNGEAIWIGSQGFGLSCLDGQGWHTFTKENSPLPGDWINDLTVCPDGKTWVTSSSGISYTDGANWVVLGYPLDYNSTNSIACDSKGGVWAAHFKGVSYYDGQGWTNYDPAKLGSSDKYNNVVDIAVGPDGKVWALLNNSILSYDGNTWSVFERDKGFSEQFFFDQIIVDSKSQVFASYTSGLLTYDGKSWRKLEGRHLSQVKSMALDPQGRLWVGTFARGVSVFNGSGWVTYNTQNSKLSSDKIRSIAADGQGRMWIGTWWGLNVFDGKDWAAYRMDNADIVDSDINALAAGGNGPSLPQLAKKENGSLSGKLNKGTDPAAGITVEVCPETVGMLYSGASPCADNPGHRTGVTDSAGEFLFSDLPSGRYSISFKGQDGKWYYLTGAFGFVDKRVLVNPGETIEVGSIDITKKD